MVLILVSKNKTQTKSTPKSTLFTCKVSGPLMFLLMSDNELRQRETQSLTVGPGQALLDRLVL